MYEAYPKPCDTALHGGFSAKETCRTERKELALIKGLRLAGEMVGFLRALLKVQILFQLSGRVNKN